MELYNPDNAAADIQRIKEEIEPYWKQRFEAGAVKSYTIVAGYQNMNLFWATCEYLPTKDGERFGPITAHYNILIKDGKLEFHSPL